MKEKYLLVEKIIKDASKIMMEGAKKLQSAGIKTKGEANNFVTEYDVAVQHFLEEKLSVIFPGVMYLAEEDGESGNKLSDELTFIIDPIDGTANFMYTVRHSAISVGLFKDNKPIFGAVYNPYSDEYFSAVKGEGAYLNGEKINVSDRTDGAAVIAVGTAPYYKETRGKETMTLLYELLMKFGDLRRMGAASLDICYVAAGRVDGFCELKLSPWDFAAGALILEEAGGKITDFSGNELDYGKPSSIMCANAVNYDKLIEITRDL